MPRSLLPREHGAYVQLAAPLVASSILAPSVAGALLAVAASLAFVANESLLVVLGHRGKRMKIADGARARRWLRVLVTGAVLAGGAGLVLAPQVFVTATLVALPVCVLVGLAWRRKERTLAGELVAAVALTGASAPVAVAGGASLGAAGWMWAGWALGYALTVFAVHRVLARHKRPASADDVVAFTIVLVVSGILAGIGLLIALPLAVSALALLIIVPSAKHLRAIGFGLVGASIVSILLPHVGA